MTQIMAFFVIVWAVEKGAKLVATKPVGSGIGMGDQTARMVDLTRGSPASNAPNANAP